MKEDVEAYMGYTQVFDAEQTAASCQAVNETEQLNLLFAIFAELRQLRREIAELKAIMIQIQQKD